MLYSIVLIPRLSSKPYIFIKAIVYTFHILYLFNSDTVYTIYKQKKSIELIQDIFNFSNYNKHTHFNINLIQVY